MGILDSFSPRKRREKEILASLASIAVSEVGDDEFRAASAFVRAYGVALGITVPEHTTKILFADNVEYLRDAWKADDTKIIELASYLSWTQTMAALDELGELAESEEQAKKMRLTLMTVTGRVFHASDRAMSVMHDLSDALGSSERQRELMENNVFLAPDHPRMGLHFRAVAQLLDKPWKTGDVDAAIIYDAQRFLTLLCGDATTYFRRRALEIFKAHVEHGVRPI
jgi:hypothetical protein